MSRLPKVYIIAEAGVNHNGSLDMAIDLVDVAVQSGADAIKFQTYQTENIVSKHAKKALYQIDENSPDKTQCEMLKRLELSHDAHSKIFSYCRRRGIQFLSTAFDIDSLRFLNDELNLPLYKIASGEITNAPLLLAFSKTNKPLVLSTGMSTLAEVEQALSVLAFGACCSQEAPSLSAFQRAYVSDDGQSYLKKMVTLMHCTSIYPAPFDKVNLLAMNTLRHAFGLKVGYSDHTNGIAVSIAAATLGATVIEKHFTLDKSLPGPDHKASLEPVELKSMVDSIRQVESAMGTSVKKFLPEEMDIRMCARKSLVAATDIERNQVLDQRHISILRPGMGVSPMHYWSALGRRSTGSIQRGELIDI